MNGQQKSFFSTVLLSQLKFFSLLACLFFFNSCVEKKATYCENVGLSSAPARVLVSLVKLESIEDQLEFPGTVESCIRAIVQSETRGWVSSISVKLGQKVSPGQVLMTIQNQDPVYHYSRLLVRSTISGVVSKIMITTGSNVGPDQRLAYLVNPNELRITSEVPALERAHIQVGTQALFKSGISIPIRASGISPTVDPVSGTVSVEWVLIDKFTPNVLPGMVGKIIMQGKKHQSIFVPETAIFYKEQQAFVYLLTQASEEASPSLIKKSRVESRLVSLGEHRMGRVEVLSGLKEGEPLVQRFSRLLKIGEYVEVDSKEF